MQPPKRIIVGHDLRTGGETALKTASVLAKRFGAELRLVHVVEPLHFYQRISHPLTSAHTIEEISQKIGVKLQGLTKRPDLAHLKVEYEVRRGKPFVELIIARRAWQADMIVVGGPSHEEERLSVGRGQGVLRKALVPVLVAKKELSAEPKTILLATDFSPCAKKAAEAALMLAKSFCAKIIFVHVVDLYPSYAVAYTDDIGVSVPLPPPAPEELEIEWEHFFSGLPLERVKWEKITQEGDSATSILAQAQLKHVDLIVMGTHGRTGLEYMLLGSVAGSVVDRADRPVLTIRPEAFEFKMP